MAEKNVSSKSWWIGVATIVLSLLGGLLSGAMLIGSTMKRVEVIEVRQKAVEVRVTSIETDVRRDGRKLDEISINLKTLMRSQGLRYETADGNGGGNE